MIIAQYKKDAARSALNKLRTVEPFTDNELRFGIDVIKNILEVLDTSDHRFYLVQAELHRNLLELERIQENRNRD